MLYVLTWLKDACEKNYVKLTLSALICTCAVCKGVLAVLDLVYPSVLLFPSPPVDAGPCARNTNCESVP